MSAIDPGVGYRLLAVGEVRRLGDEWFSSALTPPSGWLPLTEDGGTIGTPLPIGANPQRRAVRPAPAVGFRRADAGETVSADAWCGTTIPLSRRGGVAATDHEWLVPWPEDPRIAKPAEDSEEMVSGDNPLCGAEMAGMVCTRIRGHRGVHVAHGTRGEVIRRWNDGHILADPPAPRAMTVGEIRAALPWKSPTPPAGWGAVPEGGSPGEGSICINGTMGIAAGSVGEGRIGAPLTQFPRFYSEAEGYMGWIRPVSAPAPQPGLRIAEERHRDGRIFSRGVDSRPCDASMLSRVPAYTHPRTRPTLTVFAGGHDDSDIPDVSAEELPYWRLPCGR